MLLIYISVVERGERVSFILLHIYTIIIKCLNTQLQFCNKKIVYFILCKYSKNKFSSIFNLHKYIIFCSIFIYFVHFCGAIIYISEIVVYGKVNNLKINRTNFATARTDY